MRYAERSIAAGSANGSPSTRSSTGSPARRTSSSSGVEAAEPGLRRELGTVVVLAAHRAEQPAHLAERRSGRSARRRAARRRPRRSARRQPVPDGADLQHHDADRVGDDVVQLAGDPGALLGDGDARRRPRARARRACALLGLSACSARSRMREARRARRARRWPGRAGPRSRSWSGSLRAMIAALPSDDRRARSAPWRSSRSEPIRNAATMPGGVDAGRGRPPGGRRGRTAPPRAATATPAP